MSSEQTLSSMNILIEQVTKLTAENATLKKEVKNAKKLVKLSQKLGLLVATKASEMQSVIDDVIIPVARGTLHKLELNGPSTLHLTATATGDCIIAIDISSVKGASERTSERRFDVRLYIDKHLHVTLCEHGFKNGHKTVTGIANLLSAIDTLTTYCSQLTTEVKTEAKAECAKKANDVPMKAKKLAEIISQIPGCENVSINEETGMGVVRCDSADDAAELIIRVQQAMNDL